MTVVIIIAVSKKIARGNQTAVSAVFMEEKWNIYRPDAFAILSPSA